MIFSGFNDVDCSSDIFSSEEFGDKSFLFSIQIDKSKMVNSESANYSIMGSNISGLEADMVSLKSDSSSIPLVNAFTNDNFPFKYIGIKYTAGQATGTISILWERKSQSTILN